MATPGPEGEWERGGPKLKESSAVGEGHLAETRTENSSGLALVWRGGSLGEEGRLSCCANKFCRFPSPRPYKLHGETPRAKSRVRRQRVDLQGKWRISHTAERSLKPGKSNRPFFSANFMSAPLLPHLPTEIGWPYLLLYCLSVAPSHLQRGGVQCSGWENINRRLL